MKTKIKFLIFPIIAVVTMAWTLSGCEKDDVFETDLALNTDTLRITKDEITTNVLVFSNTNWDVEVQDADYAWWLTLPESDDLRTLNGSGTSYFRLKAETNGDDMIRYGTLVIKTATSNKKLVVVQDRY